MSKIKNLRRVSLKDLAKESGLFTPKEIKAILARLKKK